MQAMAVPIVPGKYDAWRSWIDELKGARSAEFADSNTRHKLTGHNAWLQTNPDGSQMVVVVHDGPGAESYMGAILSSDDPFDKWFANAIMDAHGFDPSMPPPPLPEQVL
jgi:hypothetical protein